jgi:phosphinothricin acetyltransferase
MLIEEPNIRAVEADDAARMAEIYNYYVENTIITFESEPVTPAEFLRRIGAHPEQLPWYVIEDSGIVIGYCYAAPWKQRSAYAHSVETSIYLDKGACGKGLGKRAYSFLIANLEHVHAIMGGIALPNDTSIALHEALGFQKVAHFKEVGRKFERWIDVGYWQLLPGGQVDAEPDFIR